MNPLATLFEESSRELKPLHTNETVTLPKLPGIKGVVFDIYGTLMISGVGDISLSQGAERQEAIEAALEAVGCPLKQPVEGLTDQLLAVIEAQQGQQKARGIEYPEVDIRKVWEALLLNLKAEGGVDDLPSPEQIEALAIDYELRVNPVWPMPCLAEVLQALREGGYRLGIVSNAQFFTPLMFEAFLGKPLEQLGFPPERCVYSFDLLEAKPSTRLYERVVEQFEREGLSCAAELLYVGNDLRNDVWPAQQTGMKTALFAGDQRSLRWRRDDPRLTNLRPDAVVTELPQILAMIGA